MINMKSEKTTKELIRLERKVIWTDSRVIAEHFADNNHYRVKRIIVQLIEDFEIKGDLKSGLNPDEDPVIQKKKGVYRNQEYEYFLLNKSAFILLAMRFKTKQAQEWQLKFVKAFLRMEKAIARHSNEEWIQARQQGIIARKAETDIIKEYIDYAKGQGSKNAERYYIHYTKATYKALKLLEHNKPKTRDMLDVFEVNELFMAEVVVAKSLRKYMALDTHYKTIFQLVKEDLEKYADLVNMRGLKKLKVGS